MIETMWKVLGKIDQYGFGLNRVSVHAINFHLLCFDSKIWRSGKLSVASSIQVALKMAGGYSDGEFPRILEDLEKLRFTLPNEMTIKTKKGTTFKSQGDLIREPVFSFDYGRRA